MFHRQPQEAANTDTATAEKMQEPKTPANETGKEKSNMSETSNTTVVEPSVEPAAQSEPASPALSVPGGMSFQRPPVVGGGFPGSYNKGSSASAPSSSSYAGRDSDSRLTIGRGITMSGEIESCDTLIVEGTVEAALKGAKVLDIAESGVFYGTVEIEEAVISGRFEGDIVVNGRLTVTSSGSVTGSIAYQELAIEAGATIDGRIAPLSASGAKVARPANANMGSELPFAEKAAAE